MVWGGGQMIHGLRQLGGGQIIDNVGGGGRSKEGNSSWLGGG